MFPGSWNGILWLDLVDPRHKQKGSWVPEVTHQTEPKKKREKKPKTPDEELGTQWNKEQ